MSTENSDSEILVVQPTDERMGRNASDPLNRTRYRGILVQGTMCPRPIIIICVGAQNSAQVLLAQPEAFIQAKDGLFEADGSIGAASRQFLQGWMDRYAGWIRKHAV